MIVLNGDAYTIPKVDKKKVEDMFPDFFHDNPAKRKGVQLDYPRNTIKHDNGRVIKNPVRGLGVNAKAHIEGQVHEITYCERLVDNGSRTGSVVTEPGFILLEDRQTLRPGIDNDLLYFLALYSNEIKNNLCPDEFKRGRTKFPFEFFMPERIAKDKLFRIQETSRAKGLAVDSQRLPDEKVVKVCEAMFIPGAKDMDIATLRVHLHDELLNDRDTCEKFLEIMDNEPLLEARMVIQKAIENRIIRFQTKNQVWETLDLDGEVVQELCKVGVRSVPEDVLWNFFKENTNVYNEIRRKALSLDMSHDIELKKRELAKQEEYIKIKEQEIELKAKQKDLERLEVEVEEGKLSEGESVKDGKKVQLKRSSDFGNAPVFRGQFNKFLLEHDLSMADLDYIFKDEDRDWFLKREKEEKAKLGH